jgi:hypothetical protein
MYILPLSFYLSQGTVSIGRITPDCQGEYPTSLAYHQGCGSSISLTQFAQDGLGDHTYQVGIGVKLGYRLDVLAVYVAHATYLAELLFLTWVGQSHLLALFQELFDVFGGEGLAASQLLQNQGDAGDLFQRL